MLEQKKAITEKSLTPTGLTLNNNMAAVLLFCNANMATPLKSGLVMDALTIAIPLQQQRQQKALINKNFI